MIRVTFEMWRQRLEGPMQTLKVLRGPLLRAGRSTPAFFAASLLWIAGTTAALAAFGQIRSTTYLCARCASLSVSIFERRWYLSALFLVSTMWFAWCFGCF